MKKRISALLLTCVMVLAMTLPVHGASPVSEDHAGKLSSLHLFQGTASGYNLDAAPTRLQGLIMLTRLLGLEDEALACQDPNPFTDVTGTGDRYAAYAYANGLTKGTGASTFTPGRILSPANYTTFLLRALGYDDGQGDFAVTGALSFAASLKLMTAEAASKLAAFSMTRGDLVDLSYAALTCPMKDGSRTLAEKLRDEGVFTSAEGEAAGVLGSGAGWTYPAPASKPVATVKPAAGPAIQYEKKTIGSVTAHVLTVDPKRADVKTALVDNKLGHTAPFASIVKNSGAAAVVNGNFFASYSPFKIPIGHVMVNGYFLYGSSGVSSLGITSDGEVRVGRPALFTRIKAADTSWTAYEINVPNPSGSVLYTPAYGPSVVFAQSGSVMTVAAGTITGYQSVTAGGSMAIPADGYLVFMDAAFTSADYFRTPVSGTPVTMEYYLHKEDPEGFTLENLVSVVSGAPRLVQDGKIYTELEPGFTEARFTTAVAPRTAIGVNAAGRLVIVSVPSASIQQMRIVMQTLGCVDAFNLDGGASCGMYYNGAYYAKPGRELTVTLQIFPK